MEKRNCFRKRKSWGGGAAPRPWAGGRKRGKRGGGPTFFFPNQIKSNRLVPKCWILKFEGPRAKANLGKLKSPVMLAHGHPSPGRCDIITTGNSAGMKAPDFRPSLQGTRARAFKPR